MNNLGGHATRQRPNQITLILAASNQTDLVVKLAKELPADFSGAVILAQTGTEETLSELESRLRASTELAVRRVAGRVSLVRGRVYLINSQLQYELTGADQLHPTTANSANGVLLASLRERYLTKARIILLSTAFTSELGKLPATSKLKPHLISLKALADMAAELFKRLATIYDLQLCTTDEELFTQSRARLKSAASAATLRTSQRPGFEQIVDLLKSYRSTDFSQYKEASLIAQIERRMRRLRFYNLEQYADRLRVDSQELESLHNSLLIGMTRFFRDTPVFVELQKQLISYIEKTGTTRLDIWSAGCSTGAEAYTLALIADLIRREYAPELRVHIYATDNDQGALKVAEAGLYCREEIEHIPAEYLPRPIGRTEGRFDLKNFIETDVVFEQHDLLQPSSHRDLDLIVCRNVFIYFTPETQLRQLENLHRSLKPGGLLMLGRSESTSGQRSHFTILSERAKIYRALQLSPSS